MRSLKPASFLALALFLLPKCALGAVDDPPKAKARELIEAWQAEEALALAKRELTGSPQDPELLELSAEAAYYLGDYEQSLRWYDSASSRGKQGERALAMRLLVQQTRDVVRDYRIFLSPHFELKLDSRTDVILAEYALDALERSYAAMREGLGFLPKDRVRVEIFPDARSFNAVSTLSLRDIEVTGAVGICKFNKIMLLSPRALMSGFRWLDSLSHEYVHYAVVFLTRNKAPIWVHEGLARYEESRWRDPGLLYLTPVTQNLLAGALRTGKFIGFQRMDPSLINLDTPEEVQQAYAEAASAIDFLASRKGRAALKDFLAATGGDRGTEGALWEVVGLDWGGFEREWKQFLREKELKENEGARVRRLKVRERGEPADEEGVELVEIQSLVARNRTQLGDRLASRGMLKAAQWEYERARDASPHSPLILNKLGKSQVRLGKREEAVRSFQGALAIDPDYGAAHLNLGSLRLAMELFGPARDSLVEAIGINPFNPSLHAMLAKAYRGVGDDEGASREERILKQLLQEGR